MAAFVSAIVTAVQAAATWYSTASIFVKAAFNIGASFITSKLINKSSKNKAQASQGGRIQLPPQTNNKIPVVYGTAYVNGVITDARLVSSSGKTNDTMYYCIVLSETANTTWINSQPQYTIEDIYWNDLKLVFESTSGNRHKVLKGVKSVDGTDDFEDTNFKDGSTNFVEMRVYAGNSTAQVFPQTDTAQYAYDYWPSDDSLRKYWNNAAYGGTVNMQGLVFAIVKVRYSSEKGFTGLPNITFKLKNSLTNPAEVLYDYMTSNRFGANISSADINLTALANWYEHCDQYYTGSTWSNFRTTQPARYSINGIIDTSRPVKENIDQILQNSAAWLSYDINAGQWRVYPQWIQSPVLTFTDDNIVGGIELSSTSLEDMYNQLEVEYCDRNNFDQRLYARDSIPAYVNGGTGFMRNPNEPDNKLTMSLDLVNNNIQALRIGRIQLKQTRDDLVIKFLTTHYGLQAQAGDVVNVKIGLYGWTTGEYIDGKPFRITRIKEIETEDGALLAEIQALEYNEDVYTEEATSEFIPSANLGIKPADSLPKISVAIPANGQDPAATVPNFDIVYTYSGSDKFLADEIRVYAIETITGSNPDTLNYKFVGSIRPNPGQDFTGPNFSYTQNVSGLPETAVGNSYFVRARFVRNGRVGPISDPVSITWSPQTITPIAVGTNTEFSPSSLALATTSSGVYGGGTQQVRQYVLFGTQRLNLYTTPPATGQPTSMGADQWTMNDLQYVGVSFTSASYDGTNDEIVYNITGLLNTNSGFTEPAYVRGRLWYKTSTGDLNDLGIREFQIVQNRGGAQGVQGVGLQGLQGGQGVQGVLGANGYNNAIVYAYKRSSSIINSTIDNPGTITYSFATASVTTPLSNNWSLSIPSGTDPVYVVAGSASSQNTTDNIYANEWSTAVQLAKNGSDGLNGISNATVFLYARNNSQSVAPSFRSGGTSRYYFKRSGLNRITGQPTNWSIEIPQSGGNYVWVLQATAISAITQTDPDPYADILDSDFSTPSLFVQPGSQGVQGSQGTQAAQGAQGTGGQNGLQGSQGVGGQNGFQGVQGSNGQTGAAAYSIDIVAFDTTQPVSFTYTPPTTSGIPGTFTPNNGVTKLKGTVVNITSPTFSWSITNVSSTQLQTSLYVNDTVTLTASNPILGIDYSTIQVTLTVNGQNSIGQAISTSKTVSIGVLTNGSLLTDTVSIYQWATTTPTKPNSDSTYIWRLGSLDNATVPFGWYRKQNIPAGSPGQALYELSKVIAERYTGVNQSTTIDWNIDTSFSVISYNGTQGTSGTNGTQGTSGTNGTQGTSGTNGTQGTAGQNGTQGTAGTNGTQGTTGNPGSRTRYWQRTTSDLASPNAAEIALYFPGGLVNGDVAIIRNSSNSQSAIYEWVGSWTPRSTLFSGDVIATGTIKGEKLAAGTIVSSNIATNGLQGTVLQSTTITGDKIATGTIQSVNIRTESIQGVSIQANSITSAKILADSITGNSLQANSITSAKILANSITANSLQAASITADKISSTETYALNLKVGTATRLGTSMQSGTAGAVFERNGPFSIGSNATNMTFDGSTLYMYGNIVGTGNIQLGSVTSVSQGVALASRQLTRVTTLPSAYGSGSLPVGWAGDTRGFALPSDPSILANTGSRILINWSMSYYTNTNRTNLIEVWRAYNANGWQFTRLIGYGAYNVGEGTVDANYAIQGEEIAAGTWIDDGPSFGRQNYYILVFGSSQKKDIFVSNVTMVLTELKR
jgi:hypothetical protein